MKLRVPLTSLFQWGLLALPLFGVVAACTGKAYPAPAMTAAACVEAGWASFQIEGMT